MLPCSLRSCQAALCNVTHSIGVVVMAGMLNLIDLAGSERLSRSGAMGDRLKETQAINKSLSALGVQAALPYLYI